MKTTVSRKGMTVALIRQQQTAVKALLVILATRPPKPAGQCRSESSIIYVKLVKDSCKPGERKFGPCTEILRALLFLKIICRKIIFHYTTTKTHSFHIGFRSRKLTFPNDSFKLPLKISSLILSTLCNEMNRPIIFISK